MSSGMTPSRTSAAGHIGVTASGALDVTSDVYVALEVDGLTSFFSQEIDGATGGRAVLSVRGNVLVGKRFLRRAAQNFRTKRPWTVCGVVAPVWVSFANTGRLLGWSRAFSGKNTPYEIPAKKPSRTLL